ncbi:hypothetical protein [Hominifimenecus sp. rT4P-3]|uniref:hypothetical protein n=1 Tax=Hominifimenecus sp. rT4P-3 TaxID=3242979 RepID=UPI003DA68A5D
MGKRKARKCLALMLAATMVLSMSMTVFASPDSDGTAAGCTQSEGCLAEIHEPECPENAELTEESSAADAAEVETWEPTGEDLVEMAATPEKVCIEGCTLEQGHEGPCVPLETENAGEPETTAEEESVVTMETETPVELVETEQTDLAALPEIGMELPALFSQTENPVEDPACQIGETPYQTIAEAISAIGNGTEAMGSIIVLSRDVEESIEIPYEMTRTNADGGSETIQMRVELDLNGHTLTGVKNANGEMKDVVTNYGVLTIRDKGETTGTILGGADDDSNKADRKGIALNNKSGAVCYIESGTIKRGDTGFGNYTVKNEGAMYVMGGTITNNSNVSSLVINCGEMVISGGTVRQDRFTAVKNEYNATSLLITGSAEVISENNQPLQNWSKAVIDGGSVSGGNITSYSCVYENVKNVPAGTVANATLEIRGGEIECNQIWAANYRTTDGNITYTENPDESLKVLISGGRITTHAGIVRVGMTDGAAAAYNAGTVRVTGGSIYRKEGGLAAALTSFEKYMPDGYELNENGTVVIDRTESSDDVAVVNGRYYNKLQNAIDAAGARGEVRLLKPVSEGVVIGESQNITLDLNGQTISVEGNYGIINWGTLTVKDDSEAKNGTVSGMYGMYSAGTLNVEAGNFAGAENGAAIFSTGTAVISGGTYEGMYGIISNGPLTIDGESVQIHGTLEGIRLQTVAGSLTMTAGSVSDGEYGIAIVGGSSASLSGTAEISGTSCGVSMLGNDESKATALTVAGECSIAGGWYAIAGSGNKAYTGETTIEITGGSISQTGDADGVAIFHPQKGTLTISGDDTEITGKTGVQMCAGNLEVSGGVIRATGTTSVADKTDKNGTIQDSAAVSVVNRNYPGGAPSLAITGGTFIAASGVEAVQIYTYDDKTPGVQTDWTEADAAVEAGEFSSSVDENYLAENMNAELYSPEKNAEAPYSYYTDMNAAIQDAQSGNVIKNMNPPENAEAAEVTLADDDGTILTIQAYVGDQISLPQPADREGYTFQGWSDGTNTATDILTISGAAHLSAVWEANRVDPTEPSETDPTEPAPTEPTPTEPAPTNPAPTDPVPTDPVVPAPTEPAADPAPVTPAPVRPNTNQTNRPQNNQNNQDDEDEPNQTPETTAQETTAPETQPATQEAAASTEDIEAESVPLAEGGTEDITEASVPLAAPESSFNQTALIVICAIAAAVAAAGWLIFILAKKRKKEER